MAQYQLSVEDTIDFPVNLDIRSGRVQKNFFFHLTAKRLSTDEWRSYLAEDGERRRTPTTDFLRDHITGWRGQQLVLDDDGKPAEFSAAALDAMFTVIGVEMLIFTAYQRASFTNDGDSGRRKNSAS